MNPLLLDLGPFQVHWYGLLIVFGALVAAWISTIEAKRRGEDPEHVWNLLIWVLILGIIGARLYHVFSTPTGNFAGWAYYREHPIDIIAFWNGGFRGLGIYGAVLGGILGVIIYIAHRQGSGRQTGAPEAVALAGHPDPRPAAGAGHRPAGQPHQPGALRPGHHPALGLPHQPELSLPGAGRLADGVRPARPPHRRRAAVVRRKRLPPDLLL